MTRRALWLLEACIFLIVSIPLAVLPLRFSICAGKFFGLLLFYIWSSRRRIAIENIKLSAISCQQSARVLAKESFKNFGRAFAEVIKIYYGRDKKIIDSVEVEGAENFNRAKAKGKGVIFITGHCGNWELLSIVTSVKISSVAVIARQINNPYINKFIEGVRERYGNRVIYKRGALKNIVKHLRENGCVGILMDQAVLRDEGYVIDFLGRKAWTTKMPALIARKYGAAVIPAFIHREGNSHRIIFYPEVELSKAKDKEEAIIEDTKKFSRCIENYIKEHPAEWLWIHRRWKRIKNEQQEDTNN